MPRTLIVSKPSVQPDANHQPTGGAIARSFTALRTWAYGHWLRSVIVAGTIIAMIATTMAGWAYLADAALKASETTLDAALTALDEGRYEEARAEVGQILNNSQTPRDQYGGPLYVLGVIKVIDAEHHSRADRRRTEYLVASRYLKEARAFGIPKQRAAHGQYLLGKSLIESGQFEEGLEALDELVSGQLSKEQGLVAKAHLLLAETCLTMPRPQLEKSLSYNAICTSMPALTDDERTQAQLQRAECLSRMTRFDEAKQTIKEIQAKDKRLRASVALVHGVIELDEINVSIQRIAPPDRKNVLAASKDKISAAIANLQQAQVLDAQKSDTTRASSYHLARGLYWQGDSQAALKQFARTRQLYDETFEGLAASLAEADLLREGGDIEGAAIAYRRVLESFGKVPVYRSYVLTLPEIRDRIMAALRDFVDRKLFSEAMAMIDRFQPLFTYAEQLELRGGTLEQWGTSLTLQSEQPGARDKNYTEGLRLLRAAGLAFRQLADLRFATKHYVEDLWRGAECYFRGHSFTQCVSLLNEYLKYEPELRNAEALLRIGQAQLALGQYPTSIAAFEECIEFHPLDTASYQARIDCAKAYWHEGNMKRAEQLLRQNIIGSALKPTSPEWRDSLFELGMLLHETGAHQEAIGTLEEAIERYPDYSQRLLAQYEIGESYRRWAKEELDALANIRTSTERAKRKQVATTRFNTALTHFKEVQVTITLKAHDIRNDPLMGTMLRNCYMLEGTVLYDLERYQEAIVAFSNVASLYPDDPFAIETFVQIANCWRRLNRIDNARGAVKQAQIALDGLPENVDFQNSTALNRDEWRSLLADMSKW